MELFGEKITLGRFEENSCLLEQMLGEIKFSKSNYRISIGFFLEKFQI
jgi:hypothetical protein